MSEVAHNAQHEFWRPPAAQPGAAGPNMVEACDGCGTEFMVGAVSTAAALSSVKRSR